MVGNPISSDSMAGVIAGDFAIEVFFDGDCPLCLREMAMIQRRDKRKLIRFSDISATGFDTDSVGLCRTVLMSHIHGRLPDGSIVEGVEVFRRLYTVIGYGGVVAISRIPGLSHLLEFGYRIFAAQRFRLTGRCASTSCSMHSKAMD